MEENIQNNNVQQLTQPINATQTNNVQPITVPLQIQPVVQQPTTQQNTLNNLPNVSTFDTSNQQQSTTIAPTPVQYNNPVQQTQVQQAPVQNNNQYKINKIDTSQFDNTTIEGQYRSTYGNAINQILSELYNNRYFDYNPNEDLALQQAMDYSTKTTTSALASRGILNSTITAERIARVVSELTTEYRKLALSEWQTQMNMLANVGQLYMNMDEYEFKKWQDARDQQWKERLQAYQEKQDEIKNAWARVDELGYVDNKASTVLGVAVGTLSKDAREAKEAYQRELEMIQRKAEVEYKTEKKLAELKTELEKEMIQYEAQYSSKTNNVSLSTYDSIIQNRWTDYDDFTKKYSVRWTEGEKGKEGYKEYDYNDEVYNFLVNEYASGRMSENDYITLISKYGITTPIGESLSEKPSTEEMNEIKKSRLEYLRKLSEL